MPHHNLPSLPTPFIGRRTVERIEALLHDADCRLLTLLGPGGTGKTRLAFEVARRAAQTDDTLYPDGVYFVSLTPLTDAEYIVSTIAQAIDFHFFEQKDPRQQLLNHLSARALLLVLDNFEHLLEGAPLVAELLAAAPRVKVLTTSRERLNVQEEWVLEVGGMRIPDEPIPLEHVEQYSAIQMFLQGARRAKADFVPTLENLPSIMRICRAVEGMPLAIELAASWVRTLTPDDIAAELTRSLDILETPSRNVPERHRSMRAMMRHTWSLLTPAERETFQAMSVFRAGFTREAAESVSGASLWMLQTLVDKSLLKRDIDGRYRIHELLRQFAAEQLERQAGAADTALDRHAAYYLDFAARQWPLLTSARQLDTLETMRRELENVRAAWSYAAQRQQLDRLQPALLPLWYFHLLTYRYEDGRQMFLSADKSLRVCKYGDEAARAFYAYFISRFSSFVSRGDVEVQMLHEALDLQATAPHPPVHRAHLLLSAIHAYTSAIGLLMRYVPDWAALLQAYAEESLVLCEQHGGIWEQAQAHYAQALVYAIKREPHLAREWGERALVLAEDSGDLSLIGNLAGPFLGQVAEFMEDYSAVRRFRHRSNEVLAHSGYWMERSWNYQGLGYAAYLQGDYQEARAYYQKALNIYLETYRGDPRRYEQINQGLINVAKMWAVEGRASDAVALLATIQTHRYTYGAVVDWAGSALHYIQTLMTPEAFEAALKRRGDYDLEAVAWAFVNNTDTPPAQNATLPEPSLAIPNSIDHLTERERDILRLIGEGKSNKEIAEAMVYSVGTVKWYVNQIFSKLQVANRTQAVVKAQELKLL